MALSAPKGGSSFQRRPGYSWGTPLTGRADPPPKRRCAGLSATRAIGVGDPDLLRGWPKPQSDCQPKGSDTGIMHAATLRAARSPSAPTNTSKVTERNYQHQIERGDLNSAPRTLRLTSRQRPSRAKAAPLSSVFSRGVACDRPGPRIRIGSAARRLRSRARRRQHQGIEQGEELHCRRCAKGGLPDFYRTHFDDRAGCQRRRENASTGRSKTASRMDAKCPHGRAFAARQTG